MSLLIPFSAAAKTFNFNFAFQDSEKSHGYTQALAPWAKKVEEATGGQLKITIYGSQTLTKGKDAWDAVKTGIADIAWCFHGYWPGMTPLADVISLPALPFTTAEQGSMTFWKLYEKFPEIQKEFSENQVLLLFTSDPYILITKDKWVKNMDDMKGLKIRMTGGPPTNMVKALGGVPTLIPMPDNYISLQKGVIDGMGSPWEAMHAFKLYEVVNYYTEVPFPSVYFSISMNKKKWNSLPKDVQAAVMSVSGLEGSKFWGHNFFDTAKDVVIDDIRKSGRKLNLYALPEKERNLWLEVGGKPIWNNWVKDMNKKGYANAQEILNTALSLSR
jgi:TRAP-type C4-dicarboxylate transport system substrate-binding protein